MAQILALQNSPNPRHCKTSKEHFVSNIEARSTGTSRLRTSKHVTTGNRPQRSFSATALGRSLLWTLLPFRAPSFSRDNVGSQKMMHSQKWCHEMPWNTQRMGIDHTVIPSYGHTVFHFWGEKSWPRTGPPLCSKLHRTQHQLKEIQPRPDTAYGSPWQDLPNLKIHIFRLNKHDIRCRSIQKSYCPCPWKQLVYIDVKLNQTKQAKRLTVLPSLPQGNSWNSTTQYPGL